LPDISTFFSRFTISSTSSLLAVPCIICICMRYSLAKSGLAINPIFDSVGSCNVLCQWPITTATGKYMIKRTTANIHRVGKTTLRNGTCSISRRYTISKKLTNVKANERYILWPERNSYQRLFIHEASNTIIRRCPFHPYKVKDEPMMRNILW